MHSACSPCVHRLLDRFQCKCVVIPRSHVPCHHPCGSISFQAKDKVRKDYEKAAKVREPLSKKLAEDPQALNKMRSEVEDLRRQLEALGSV